MKCFVCGDVIDKSEEIRFTQDDYLRAVITFFDSDNEDCKIKQKRRELCGICARNIDKILIAGKKKREGGE
jgi:hypothetical protein